MSIEFRPGWYYYSLWFADLPKQKQDSLACLFKNEKGELKTVWRMRYIKDPEPWSDKDEKKWWTINHPDDSNPETGRKHLKDVFQVAATLAGGTIEELKINGDCDKAIEALKNAPWAHMK